MYPTVQRISREKNYTDLDSVFLSSLTKVTKLNVVFGVQAQSRAGLAR